MTLRQLARKHLAPGLADNPKLVLVLAARCDVSPNTIRRYLLTAEPMQPASIRRIERTLANDDPELRAALPIDSWLAAVTHR